ncbi:transcriptional regulator [Sulfolobus sp. E5-1-F]|uniref:winged helix-turn-helix transcriptional regulator n=1 Tax=Saccharolobus sp. E5-1-F TaxID=2663019 RepID=UPI001294B1DF|nr:helix-turn-helix domain-containing protein [Sulfolobus sp. E5-1-F]QGA53790.1 transcriptional regulator [Sulfolobus sp. E5-1-F]
MVKRDKVSKQQSCPLMETINLVSRKWLLLVLNTIGNEGEVGFNSILNSINGLSPKALSDILKTMENMRLIKKEIISSSPPRVKYSLTREGKKLRKVIIPLFKWASEYTGHYECPILQSNKLNKEKYS